MNLRRRQWAGLIGIMKYASFRSTFVILSPSLKTSFSSPSYTTYEFSAFRLITDLVPPSFFGTATGTPCLPVPLEPWSSRVCLAFFALPRVIDVLLLENLECDVVEGIVSILLCNSGCNLTPIDRLL